MEKENYKVIGVMSGTSLDGLDIACCQFGLHESKWDFNIIKAETIRYDEVLRRKLIDIANSSAMELAMFDVEYGFWIGDRIQEFINKHALHEVDFIASHGHTIFHQPHKYFTLQIGNGNSIAAAAGLSVVYDFRSLDVALGGQGAPLVPAGDEFLFADYHFCLNLGGFANISFKNNSGRMAFDICPVNILLNHIAAKVGEEYDEGGKIAASGKVIPGILQQLDKIDFYRQMPPKSLGREWLEQTVLPLIENQEYSPADLMATAVEHITAQIALILNNKGDESHQVLVTGGGALNTFLIEKLRQKTKASVIIPAEEIINYKEALIFAFLGLLRMQNKINVFASVTGARTDSCSGSIVLR